VQASRDKPLRLYILDRDNADSLHYTAWLPDLRRPYTFVRDYGLDWRPPADAGIVATVQHYKSPEAPILSRLRSENRIPVLVLADGILEYRNTWQQPELPPGAIFQPALAHKVACLGRSQARQLEAWGNIGQCEVVGAPRMDRLRERGGSPRVGGSFRLLVMTARRPAFTARQRRTVRESLADMLDWHGRRSEVSGRRVQFLWRLSDGLDEELGLAGSPRNFAKRDLIGLLQRVDAVITTPSTAMLEAMLLGVPVAVLDYTLSPQYVPAAWTITAPQHIEPILAELADPPPSKMLFQQTVLHDALECRTPAAPRMARLVEQMIEIGARCRAAGKPLRFPHRILTEQAPDVVLPEASFDLRELYPDHPVFGEMDRARLQVEIGHLRRHVARLEDAVWGKPGILARAKLRLGRILQGSQLGRSLALRAPKRRRAAKAGRACRAVSSRAQRQSRRRAA